MAGNIRIGIDVGGTFTHAVAIDGAELKLVGKAKVLTTHRAAQGVAAGIIESLQLLLSGAGIAPDDVSFIAHSTTQATNALLEGDVAPVGILGMGAGGNAWLARAASNVGHIRLARDKFLKTTHRFINTSKPPSDDAIRSALSELVAGGAGAVAISEAFSVDEPDNELRALAVAEEMGLYATAGSEVSRLYGLTVRTRTAVINASMLPKMIEAATMTDRSVREAGIKAPLMIMRSDGGVMDIDSMRKRPILTILSGPAAGVAAAMMYLHISDGIFLEVGGTSTDISAIRNGKAQVKSAEVGGHKVYLRTLDVRTVGIAGGSMLRISGDRLVDVGPRSAHIAGLGYASFSPALTSPQVSLITPQPGDPSDYAVLSEGQADPSVCFTPTCAANLLGLVPEGNCARGNVEAIRKAVEPIAVRLHASPEQAADRVLEAATGKCWPVVHELIKDYKMDPAMVSLVGGGGGAAALVPFLGRHRGLRHSLAENADVISAIGVALALVRESVERQIMNPDAEAILRVRQEAVVAVQRMGADPATVEVQVEVDPKTSIVRATAFGATSLTTAKELKRALSPDERKKLVADSMRVAPEAVRLACETDHFQVYAAETTTSRLGRLFKLKHHSLRTLDETGVIRLQIKDGIAQLTTVSRTEKALADIAEDHSQYGDAGRILPAMMLLAGTKIIDLSGLLDLSQIVSVAKIELETLPQDSKTIVIASLP